MSNFDYSTGLPGGRGQAMPLPDTASGTGPDTGPGTGPKQESGPSGFVEQRKATRFVLLIRSAKLICASGEFLCIVRDVSQSGAKLRLFHPIPPDCNYEIELATGERFALEHRWNRDGQFGFRFLSPVDVPRFIAEASPFPKRPVRLRINAPGSVLVHGAAFDARLCDLSRHGARIETRQPLAIGQKLKLRVAGMPTIEAAVCWRNAPAFGLVFPCGFSFEELARLTYTLQTCLALDNSSSGATDWLVGTG